jgi:membrane-bound ClpP family serine protease
MFNDKSTNCIFNGLVALSLSLIIWKFTGNFWGWLALSVPGSALVIYGWYLILKGD